MELKRAFSHCIIDEKVMRRILSSTIVLCLVLIIGLLSSVDAGACASCGCTLSPDWQNLQFAYIPGIRLDFNWVFLNQYQLRSGTGTISPVAASRIVNNGMPEEVEQYTTNNYYTLGIDYSTSPDWGINIQIPFIDRRHSTLGTNSNGITAGPGGGQYESHTDSFGDITVVGRYQGFIPGCTPLGVLFGLKLPSGSNSKYGISTDPTAPGPVLIDPGLQPGTGTTGAILGLYYSNALNVDWGYFAQLIGQAPLYEADQYRPGASMNFNMGLRYMGFSGFTPQLQFNYKAAMRDSGAIADIYNTGGVLLYISPGISVRIISNKLFAYGFVQVPLYQNVNGVQLSPYYTTSVGVRYVF